MMQSFATLGRAWGVPVVAVNVMVSGCSCDSLYGVDSPRPTLSDRDSFDVDPACPELALDTAALAAVPRIITLTAKRASGLGAESVPVSVRMGSCTADEVDAGRTDPSAAHPPRDPTPDSSTTPSAQTCVNGMPPLDHVTMSSFALTADEEHGCRSRSPSRVDCTLDARGEARFGVVGEVPADGISLTGYLPLCITPLELGAGRPAHQIELGLVPRLGTSRVALAAVQLQGGDVPPTVEQGATCDALIDCSALRARARLQVGVVSADIPSGQARDTDFRPVIQQVSVRAGLRVLTELPSGSPMPFLSTEGSCSGADESAGQDAGVEETALSGPSLHIRREQRGSEIIYLCASGHGASYEITPELFADNAAQPRLEPSVVSLVPLREAYMAERREDDMTLLARDCGGSPVAATQDAVMIGGRLSMHPDGDRILIAECGPPTPVSTADGRARPAAGDAAADAAMSDPAEPQPAETAVEDSFTCESMQLELLTGGTCALNIPVE